MYRNFWLYTIRWHFFTLCDERIPLFSQKKFKISFCLVSRQKFVRKLLCINKKIVFEKSVRSFSRFCIIRKNMSIPRFTSRSRLKQCLVSVVPKVKVLTSTHQYKHHLSFCDDIEHYFKGLGYLIWCYNVYPDEKNQTAFISSKPF